MAARRRHLDLRHPEPVGGCHSPARFDELLPVGAQPDWDPADVPAARGPSCCAPDQPKPAPKKLGLELPKGVKLAAALRKGIAVTVDAGAAGNANATAKLKRSKACSGVATVGASGKAKVGTRFSRKAARSLRKRKSVRLAIAVGFKPVTGAPVKRSASLTLKRWRRAH